MINKFMLPVFAGVAMLSAASCTNVKHTMREPNAIVKLTREDFALSPQVSASAKTVTVFGIDFPRLFRKEEGSIGGGFSAASVPLIGNYISDRTANYALYNMMRNNPGYDVAFYPQYESKVQRPVLGLGFIVKISEVNATARLGKLAGDDE